MPPQTRSQAAAEAAETNRGEQEDSDASDEDDDNAEDAWGSDDEEDGLAAAPVLAVKCASCHMILSERGMAVHLVADFRCTLYSTDIPSSHVRSGTAKPIPTCECAAVKTHCVRCEQEVGYRVVAPCEGCLLGGNNGHYWLFDQGVTAESRGFSWGQLPYNGDTQPVMLSDEPAVDVAVDDDDGAEGTCAVCASCPMWRPTRVTVCGHVFCYGCISREVDARGACPLDRRRCTRDQLVATAVAAVEPD